VSTTTTAAAAAAAAAALLLLAPCLQLVPLMYMDRTVGNGFLLGLQNSKYIAVKVLPLLRFSKCCYCCAVFTVVCGCSELFNYIDLPVRDIHGKQKQAKRTSTFFEFCQADKGILLCTGVCVCVICHQPRAHTDAVVTLGNTACVMSLNSTVPSMF
jgi:hypothetical protein